MITPKWFSGDDYQATTRPWSTQGTLTAPYPLIPMIRSESLHSTLGSPTTGTETETAVARSDYGEYSGWPADSPQEDDSTVHHDNFAMKGSHQDDLRLSELMGYDIKRQRSEYMRVRRIAEKAVHPLSLGRAWRRFSSLERDESISKVRDIFDYRYVPSMFLDAEVVGTQETFVVCFCGAYVKAT